MSEWVHRSNANTPLIEMDRHRKVQSVWSEGDERKKNWSNEVQKLTHSIGNGDWKSAREQIYLCCGARNASHTHTKRDGVRHDGSKASCAAHNWLAAAAMAWQAEWLSSKWGYLWCVHSFAPHFFFLSCLLFACHACIELNVLHYFCCGADGWWCTRCIVAVGLN